MVSNSNIPLHSKPLEYSLDQCIKCNICTSVCPVSAASDLFPGPKYEAPQAGRFRYPQDPTPDRSVDYCSGCRICNLACPTGVKIAEMNARARAVMVAQGKFPARLRLRNNLVARAELVGKLAQPVAPIVNALLTSPSLRTVAEKTLGIARFAPFPAVSRERFSTWFNKREKSAKQSSKQVVYFHGCSTEYYEPRIGKAAVQVLESNGFEVIIPRQNCCGLPLLSNGEFNAARRYHRSNVNSLFAYASQGIPIVGTSTSCILTIKEEAPDLLEMHDERTMLVANQTFDLNEFLINLFEAEELNLEGLQPIPLRLPYHIPCQYRAHQLGKPGMDMLSLIPKLQVEDSHADCCGIAGTYGYKVEKYQIAMRVGKPLFDFLDEFNAPLVICDSETCRWQITHATGLLSIHPVELLSAAYGYPATDDLAKFL